jgi:hypothetical protein
MTMSSAGTPATATGADAPRVEAEARGERERCWKRAVGPGESALAGQATVRRGQPRTQEETPPPQATAGQTKRREAVAPMMGQASMREVARETNGGPSPWR